MLADGLVVALRALALHLLITLMMLSINALRWSLPNVGCFLPVTLAFVELRPLAFVELRPWLWQGERRDAHAREA